MGGIDIRLSRVKDSKSGNMVIVPMDHGVSIGPVDGLRDFGSTVSQISSGGGDAVLMQKGNLQNIEEKDTSDTGLIAHLNASTSMGEPNNKVLVGTVEEALKRGADAVSIHINIGSKTEPKQLEDLGKISEQCEKYGVPLMAMTYVRGENVDSTDVDNIAHATRVGAEIGADVVKTSYTGDPEEYKKVVEGCPVPIVIAGGPKAESKREVLQDIKDAIDIGVKGTMMGRNVFQQDDVEGMVDAITKIVHEGKSVDEAMQEAGI